MDDKEILEELSNQKIWWEKQIEAAEKKLKYYKAELAKANRLIEVFGEKVEGN